MQNQLDEIGGDIQAALIEKRSYLLSCLSLTATHVAEGDLASARDRSQVLHDDSDTLRQNRFESEMLHMIEEALNRLNTGKFGSCQACGRTIALLRLQAIPWARYCVICQNHVTSMGHEAVVRENQKTKTSVVSAK